MRVVITLLITLTVAWWLSRYDTAVTGENKAADLKRRALRCGVTLVLVALAVGCGGFAYIAAAVLLAVVWAGCLSEISARGFHGLIDSTDTREFDPGKTDRELDRLASLVRTGQKEEASQLCAQLLKSGEVSALAMEAVLARMSHQEGKSAEGIESLLVGRSPSEPPETKGDSDAASVPELLSKGYFGTAIELLEGQLKARPDDFELWLKLTEAHGRYCGNFGHAGQIITKMQANPAFTPEQIQIAKAKLQEWRTKPA